MQILEYSGEELERVAREFFMPVITRTRTDYRGRVTVHELGEAVTVSRSHWGQMSVVRTARMVARAPSDDTMLFCIHLGGRGYVHQQDRLVELTADAGVLSEARSSWERVSPTESQTLTLRFSRALLPLRTGEITEACARSMASAAPAMQILAGYLDRLFAVADDLTAPQRIDAGQAALDLLAMVLRDATPSVLGGEGPEAVLLEMMLVYVRDHLADPNLRVEELARRHHVSVRRAYTLFERIGTTPGAYLREQRLLAARAMLSDPRHCWLRVSDIANAVGFHDLSGFDRAFRRQYGMTPAGWRRERCHAGFGPADLTQEMPPRRANRPRQGFGGVNSGAT
ncbi:helix-turn-helix domain-containing protein [Pseudonocardia yunnanensis]|uniref:Helix-turn-helix transcriptional regulator n=1 Tax=Pseudonocardia yunnanensis TaxID=58107 RepID=A0ABW4ET45_9PSEU